MDYSSSDEDGFTRIASPSNIFSTEGREEEVTQEDAWAVISGYFDEKGLVRQQLDSFDEFVQNTMQELIDDSSRIRVEPERQFTVGRNEDSPEVGLEISFHQIYLGQPSQTEEDGTTTNVFPHEARLRGLTYAASLYVDIEQRSVVINRPDDASVDSDDDNDPGKSDPSNPPKLFNKEFLGNVPIMLRSNYCVLSKKTDSQLSDLNECIFDQGGYFVVNGR